MTTPEPEQPQLPEPVAAAGGWLLETAWLGILYTFGAWLWAEDQFSQWRAWRQRRRFSRDIENYLKGRAR